MKKVLEHYCLSEDCNGLLLLSLPTGFGKTYNVLNFIYENYEKYAQAGRKILFITNLKKNLPINDLKSRFDKAGKASEFDQTVLFIDSNSESVINNLLKIDVPEEFKTKTYNKIKSYIQNIDNETLPSGIKQALRADIRKEYEPAFRKYIHEILYREFKTKKERLTAIRNNENYQWIGQLYPAVFTDERTILFLSMDKFLAKNTTLIEQSYYFYERLIDDSVVFIDEFDSTKDHILKNIINSGMKHKVNLINLFLNIHNHLMQSECPAVLLKESEHRKQFQEEIGKKWLSPKELIDVLREKAYLIFENYKLQHTCKSHDEFASSKRNFLFYDYQYHQVLDARNKIIEVILDNENRANWINAVDWDEKGEGVDIRALLSDVAGFLSYFQRGISILAENYRHLKGENENVIEAFSLESAVRTTLNHFRLDSADVDFLCANVMEGCSPYGERNNRSSVKRLEFYENGFRYHDIIDSEEHDTVSKIFMYNFERTPESFLANVCEKAMVVGISATAGLFTNIGNFDLKYLEYRLGDSFYRLKGEELDRLKEDFDNATKGYTDVSIHTQFIEDSNIEDALARLEELVDDNETANELLSRIRHSLPGERDSLISYIFSRYVRVLSVWKYFLELDDCNAFLSLFNKFPKDGGVQFDLSLIKEYADMVASNVPGSESISCEDLIVVLKGDDFDKHKKALLEDLHQGKRRFIISTYQTVGAGQNLQYPIPGGRKTLKINDLPARESMDINGIYLDKPTNLLINIYGNEVSDEDFIKYLFQLEFLLENGALSTKDFNIKLDEAFQRYVGRTAARRNVDGNANLYKTEAYIRLANKMIIQAIGRICRSNMKAESIHILADESIKKYLTDFSLPEDVIPVKEYSALVDAVRLQEAEDNHYCEAENRAALVSDRTAAYIHRQLKKGWTKESVDEWQALREQVLRQPVAADIKHLDSRWGGIYVNLPKASDRYYYSEKKDFREVEVSFQGSEEKSEVSEASSRLTKLMKVPQFKEYFKECGWETCFPKFEYSLTPPMFNNIYKGALGEVCGAYVFKHFLGIDLYELDLEEFEKFDYKTDNGIYVDFKLWNGLVAVNAKAQLEKVAKKLKKVGGKKALIVNILANEEQLFKPTKSFGGQIIEVPYICRDEKIDSEAIRFLMKELTNDD